MAGDEIAKRNHDTDRFKELRESEARPMPAWLMDNASLTEK